MPPRPWPAGPAARAAGTPPPPRCAAGPAAPSDPIPAPPRVDDRQAQSPRCSPFGKRLGGRSSDDRDRPNRRAGRALDLERRGDEEERVDPIPCQLLEVDDLEDVDAVPGDQHAV